MTGGPAEDAAQDVPAALVRRDDAVGDHEGRAAHVVGDDADGDVAVMVLAVGAAGDLDDLIEDLAHAVDLEHVVDALHDAREAFEAHARVDVLVFEGLVGAVAHAVELREDVVPDLHIAVAVAAGPAVGLAAAVLFAAVEVDLGAGAAGAGAVLPEVVLLAEPRDPLRRDADGLVPEIEGLVVLFIHGREELFRRDLKGDGQKFPRPRDRLFFEVIAEGEVAEHFEIGAVPGGMADALEVGGTDAFLAGADAMARGFDLAGEVFLHRGHAGVDEQEGFVVLRDEGKGREAQVSFGFEEGEELLSQIIDRRPLHGWCSFMSYWNDFGIQHFIIA